MKLMVANNFDKNIKDKKIAYQKIENFFKLLKVCNYDYREVPYGYSCRKFQGLNGNIYKFRANQKERIIFMYSSDLNNYRDHDEALLILQYTDHDSQGLNARNHLMNKDKYNLEDFNEIEDGEFMEEDYLYNLDKEKTVIIPNFETIVELNHSILGTILEKKELFQYLNKQQFEIFTENNSSILLSGNAGSGKTILGLQKIKTLAKYRCGYFTYTSQLKNNAEKLYRSEMTANTHFNEINTYFMNKLNFNYRNFVDMHRFNKWYSIQQNPIFKQYDSLDIWAEIRGVIKGNMLCNFERIHQVNKMISKKDYLSLLDDYSYYNYVDREVIYRIALRYQEWLERESLFDENDLAYYLITYRITNQFDYVLVDEVQDLTELQIYALTRLGNNLNHFLFSGDVHQIINPTFFNFGRLENLFFNLKISQNDLSYKRCFLSYNYRSAKEIVDYINNITGIRRKYIGNQKQEEEEAEIAISKIDGNIVIANQTLENLEVILNLVSDNPYAAIVVANEPDKAKIASLIGEDFQIFTVSEIKGLEYKYIFSFNILSSYLEGWNDILGGRGKRSSRHRYYFNLFYVTLTRATHTICFYEEKLNSDIYHTLFESEQIPIIDSIDETDLGMNEEYTDEDWIKQAIKNEEAGNFKRAMRYFKNASGIIARQGEHRCDIKSMVKSSEDYLFAAEMLEEIKEYQDASDYYLKAQSYVNYLNMLVVLNYPMEFIRSKQKEYHVSFHDLFSYCSDETYKKYKDYFNEQINLIDTFDFSEVEV